MCNLARLEGTHLELHLSHKTTTPRRPHFFPLFTGKARGKVILARRSSGARQVESWQISRSRETLSLEGRKARPCEQSCSDLQQQRSFSTGPALSKQTSPCGCKNCSRPATSTTSVRASIF